MSCFLNTLEPTCSYILKIDFYLLGFNTALGFSSSDSKHSYIHHPSLKESSNAITIKLEGEYRPYQTFAVPCNQKPSLCM